MARILVNEYCLQKPYLISGLREAFPEDQILEENLEQADILISEPKNLHPQLLELMPALKLVLGSRAGYDVADLGYLKSRGIAFCNARGLYSVPIAEDIVCKILTFSTNAWLYTEQKARRIYQATAERRCLSSLTIGFWEPAPSPVKQPNVWTASGAGSSDISTQKLTRSHGSTHCTMEKPG